MSTPAMPEFRLLEATTQADAVRLAVGRDIAPCWAAHYAFSQVEKEILASQSDVLILSIAETRGGAASLIVRSDAATPNGIRIAPA